MNGRIYDPLLGRFLSADIEVQFPGSLQSFNRYSYVRNNPLSSVDPSGFEEPEPAQYLWDWLRNLWNAQNALHGNQIDAQKIDTAQSDSLPLGQAASTAGEGATFLDGQGKAMVPGVMEAVALQASDTVTGAATVVAASIDSKTAGATNLTASALSLQFESAEAIRSSTSNYITSIGGNPEGFGREFGNLEGFLGVQALSLQLAATEAASGLSVGSRTLSAENVTFNPHLPGGPNFEFTVGEGGLFLPAGRAHGANPAGGFLSMDPITCQGYVRGPLATLEKWNPATHVSDAFVPEGVRLRFSLANPHPELPGSGLGQQLQILEKADRARIIYSNTRPLSR